MTIKQLMHERTLLKAQFYQAAAKDAGRALTIQKRIDEIENMLMSGEGVIL